MNATLKHEELYRTKELLEKMRRLELIICGAGAIGSNLVENLTRQGFETIDVIDMDRIEAHNRHTQIWTTRDIGQLKANSLKNYVWNSTGIMITSIPKKLDKANIKVLFTHPAIIIDGFDNVESRKLVTEYCNQNSFECLHIGLFKDYAEVIWNDKYRIPDDTQNLDVCEYPLARNIVLMAIVVATESLIAYANNKEKKSFVITLNDLKILAI